MENDGEIKIGTGGEMILEPDEILEQIKKNAKNGDTDDLIKYDEEKKKLIIDVEALKILLEVERDGYIELISDLLIGVLKHASEKNVDYIIDHLIERIKEGIKDENGNVVMKLYDEEKKEIKIPQSWLSWGIYELLKMEGINFSIIPKKLHDHIFSLVVWKYQDRFFDMIGMKIFPKTLILEKDKNKLG
jgi:anaerobic ribonucleoside-triphosphate reductase